MNQIAFRPQSDFLRKVAEPKPDSPALDLPVIEFAFPQGEEFVVALAIMDSGIVRVHDSKLAGEFLAAARLDH